MRVSLFILARIGGAVVQFSVNCLIFTTYWWLIFLIPIVVIYYVIIQSKAKQCGKHDTMRKIITTGKYERPDRKSSKLIRSFSIKYLLSTNSIIYPVQISTKPENLLHYICNVNGLQWLLYIHSVYTYIIPYT